MLHVLHVSLFIMRCKVAVTFFECDFCHERYLPTALFIVVYKVVLAFDFVDKITLSSMHSSNDAAEQT